MINSGISAAVRTIEPKRLAMFLFALSLFWLTNNGFDTSEAVDHYKVAKHLVKTGQLGFDQPVEGVFYTGPDGRTYGSHEFGNAFLLIPIAAANTALESLATARGIDEARIERFQQFLMSFQAGVYCALLLTILYLLLIEEFGQTSREAFAGCVVLGTGTFFWNYSRNLFDGVLSGLILVASLRYLCRFRREGRSLDAFLAFALLGLGVDTRLTMALGVVASLGFVLVYCPGARLRGLLCAAIALLPFAAWQMWYNRLRTGSPFVSPVQTSLYASTNSLDGNVLVGLAGLILSPGKSLFVYAPLLLLSIAALPAFWKKHRAVATYVIALGTAWFLVHARLRNWYGAWGWGPRYMFTILPLLSLPALSLLPNLWTRKWGKATILVVFSAGFVLAVASLIGNWHYRAMLRFQQGSMGDDSFIWSPLESQPVDMLSGTADNIRVMLGMQTPVEVQGASELNSYASNRINMWWFILPHVGVPVAAVAPVVGVLAVVLVLSARTLLRRRTTPGATTELRNGT